MGILAILQENFHVQQNCFFFVTYHTKTGFLRYTFSAPAPNFGMARIFLDNGPVKVNQNMAFFGLVQYQFGLEPEF